MYDDMETANLAAADLNKRTVVIGILEFVLDQIGKTAAVLAGTTTIDPNSAIAKAKVWLMADGHPCSQLESTTGHPALWESAVDMSLLMRQEIQKKSERFQYIRIGSGGCHWEKDGWFMGRRLARHSFLTEIIEDYRGLSFNAREARLVLRAIGPKPDARRKRRDCRGVLA